MSQSSSGGSSGSSSSGGAGGGGGGGGGSKKHPDVSPPAYAMSASVERSAECVLAVLSTNTPVPPYGRSISSPCGDTSTTSTLSTSSNSIRSTNGFQSSPSRSEEENESSSSSSMRRSYPGAMVDKKSDHHHHHNHQQNNNDHHHNNEDFNNEISPATTSEKCEEGGGGGDQEEEEETDFFLESERGDEEEEEGEVEESGGGASEEASQAESIPDSFHTPSASIQNLNSSASNNNNNFNRSARGGSTKSSSSSSNKVQSSGHSRNGSKSESEPSKSPKRSSSNCSSNNRDSSNNKKDPESVKGSPEGMRKDLGTGSSSSTTGLDNITPPPQTHLLLEVTQSVESNKDSISSSGSISSRDQAILGTPARFMPKPNKKKMWYHVFYPSYKTRSSDFKRIFKDLPTEERLIVDYSCALQREILIQGRMYVSQNYISFYANIFGWETQTSIRLKDVTSITKEKTALIIPNAVQVSTETERFFFTSFVTRDSTYMMLFKLWQSSLLEEVDNPLPTKEIWKLVHSCYGDELGVAEDTDTEEFLTCADGTTGTVVSAPSVTTLISSDGDDCKSLADFDSPGCASDIAAELGVVGPDSLVEAESPVGLLNVPDIALGISSPTTDASDTTESDGDVETGASSAAIAAAAAAAITTVRPCKSVTDGSVLALPELLCPIPHTDGREVVNSSIPTDVDTLFTMLFTSSKFFLDLHTARKTFDIVQQAWQQSPDGSQKTRQVSFTVTLSHVMGPKHSQVTESQVMLPVSKPGRLYVIEVESVNAGIPYADSFYVTTHFCLTRISANETKLCIVNQIKYKKSVWKYTKGFIEKNTWAGLEEFYTYLERALKEECTKLRVLSQSPLVAPVLPGPRRRNGRKKYPAPGIPCDIVTATPGRSVIRNGSIPIAGIPLAVGNTSTATAGSQTTAEGSVVLKIILGILACLFFLNAFLYVKLTQFESSKSHLLFSPRPIAIPQNVPRNHEEWMALLQEQEDLHRLELQKWHETLLSALQVLQQAEDDLESLKFHITSYNREKFSVNSFKQALDALETRTTEAKSYIGDDSQDNLGQGQDMDNEDIKHENYKSWSSEQEDEEKKNRDAIHRREL